MTVAIVCVIKLTGFESFIRQMLQNNIKEALNSNPTIVFLRNQLLSVAAFCMVVAILFIVLFYSKGLHDFSYLQTCPNQ